ncbi:lipoprotein [Streptomyces sp. NPDC003691]
MDGSTAGRGRRRRAGFAAGTALLGVLAAGCGGSGGGGENAPQDRAGAPRPDPDVKVRQIGGKGGVCTLPFAFDIAAGWKADALSVAQGNELSEAIGGRGKAHIVCELDARPSGTTGFIRFWSPTSNGFANQTPDRAAARKALDDFVADSGLEKIAKVEHRELKTGPYQAVEVSYEGWDGFWEQTEQERHLAVATPGGIMLVEVGGQADSDHKALLPEYERIKETLRKP